MILEGAMPNVGNKMVGKNAVTPIGKHSLTKIRF